MLKRKRLPPRRDADTLRLKTPDDRPFTATVSYYPNDGRLAEVFINLSKPGSGASTMAQDLALVFSIGLQYGVPPDVVCAALSPDSPLRITLEAIGVKPR